jgi:hypothetical protein
LFSQVDQLVGGVTHRRDHSQDLVALIEGIGNNASHIPDAFRIADGGATEFLDD